MKARSLISIPVPPCFSFKECAWFLNRNYDDCLHTANEHRVTKAIMVDDQPLLLNITNNKDQLQVEAVNAAIDQNTKQAISSYITEWFDLDRDLEPFYRLLTTDEKLAYMADEYYGLRLMGIPDMFEALCWSIIGQQINLAFAYKLKRRLVEQYGTKLTVAGDTHYIFPEPAILAAIDPEDLRPFQFSGSKAKYLVGAAKAFANKDISKGMLMTMIDMEARQKALLALKGVGIWTANYVLMKSLREPGGIPFGDVGLLNALESHQIIKDRKDLASMEKLFKKFKGWESYLVFYLWRSLASPTATHHGK
jgi:DNA-3-methyladenine glycosylase II